MILVPAIMSLLGAHAWWLPRWLAPVVPSLQLEGPVAVPEPRSGAKEDTKEGPGQAANQSQRTQISRSKNDER
jgi:RND superfamily putative drug exporter